MEALDDARRERSSAASDALSRVPVRELGLVTGFIGVVALVLSQTGGTGSSHGGPLGAVVGQALWNAAQVGLLALLLSLWRAHRRWWVAVLGIATLACLPFAIYASSPGAWALTALLVVTCAAAWHGENPNLGVAIIDAPARGTPTPVKFEFLAFTATLLCSMYNFAANGGMFPYWSSIFRGIGGLVGFTPDLMAVAGGMYTLGLDGVVLPSSINPGKPVSSFGALVFAVIWTVLPFLYVVYFAALAKMAKDSPGTGLQQALCAFCILHFLFLTDLVDYRYGRGIENPMAVWAHWAEVFAWRIAILLPIYQKLATGQWLRGNGAAGVVMHYGLAAWAVGFFVYEVLIYNTARFVQFALGQDYTPLPMVLFGLPYSEKLGYHGALVLMTFVYGFMVIAMRCKRIVAREQPAPEASAAVPYPTLSIWSTRRGRT